MSIVNFLRASAVLVGVMFAGLCALPASATAQAPPPASAYGRLENVSSVAITPDGKHLAVLRAAGDTLAVEVVRSDNYDHVGAVRAPAGITFRGVDFYSNDRVLVIGTKTENKFRLQGVQDRLGMNEYARTFSLPLDGSDSVTLVFDLTTYDYQNLANIYPGPSDMPGYVHMPAFEASGGSRGSTTLTFRRVDLKTGRSQSIAKGTENTRAFIVGPGGQLAGRIDTNEISNSWTLLTRDGGGWKTLKTGKSEFGGSPFSTLTLADGKLLRGTTADELDIGALMAVDPATGVESTVFKPPGKEEMSGYVYDRARGAVVGVTYPNPLPTQKFLDAELEAVSAKLQPRFNGGYALLSDWDSARQTFVVVGEMGAAPPAYYLYRPASDSLRLMSSLYPEIPAAFVGNRQEIKYKARDGVSVPAYLTTPRNGAAKNLPLVVLVHGGPASRDTYTFDWWSSFLASRGYAVLQANYRGSSGFGAAWERAGHGQWGKRMQDDVSDGVAALVKNGIADGKRVCIVGASYGGYAALAGATLTPDLYRCAISIAGVSDLVKMFDLERDRTGRASSTTDYWTKAMGGDRAQLRAASPALLAEQVKIPVLLMHGPDDTVVPIEQSRIMERALKSAGKDVRFVTLANDDHWLSYASTRTQMLEETEKFLAANLK